MIRRKPRDPKPYPAKGGHVSGSGTFSDAPRPPAMPLQPDSQGSPSYECGCPTYGGSR